jgi:ABC-type antimicrobial peptide transport system permease subunit
MGMVAIGLIIGLAGSYWATSLIEQILYGVEPTDPTTFVVAAVGFGLVAMAACLLPAWRATRVDPVTILQAE